ncbi:MAG: glycoside hydrolase family 99-like domain-containing protein [Puniceicoccaceae bacterium]
MKSAKALIPLVIFGLLSQLNLVASKAEFVETDHHQYTETVIGAYYYPWYLKPKLFGENRWKRAMRLHLKHPQKPMAGLFDSRDDKVIGEHIEQSIRGNIDFWAVSWWGPDSRTDVAFKDHVMQHPDFHKLKYAMLYESTGRFGKFENPSYEKWIPDLQYLKDNYFDDPNYLKIDGRPVVFVYLTRVYFRDKGEEADEALRQMREQFPEIYLVGDDVFYSSMRADRQGGGYQARWAKQFDAVTAYDIYGQSIKGFGGTHAAIDYLSGNYEEAKAVANSVGTAFMPAIAPGYNDTAVRDGHPGRARYFTDVEDSAEGDIFREMIRQVALPNLDPDAANIMMVTSFNEWYEDSQIEATAGTQKPSTTDDSDSGTHYTGGQKYVDYGYLYLDILREETTGER